MDLLALCYIIGSISFIIGLKMLSNPATARKGNLIAAGGMTIAIVGTIFLYRNEADQPLHNYGWIFAGLVVGGIIGTLSAKKVKMTAMPEMVSLFNGMGGACAALISIVEFNHLTSNFSFDSSFDAGTILNAIPAISRGHILIIMLGLIIGSVSFAGSIIAWGKLNGKIKDFSFPGQHIINLALLALALIGAMVLVLNLHNGLHIAVNFSSAMIDFSLEPWVYVVFVAVLVLSLLYGVFFVLPIGGADMPVVISLLNSFTGVAAACGGFYVR
jgi:NAD(P) transhydrogenase subunit beta